MGEALSQDDTGNVRVLFPNADGETFVGNDVFKGVRAHTLDLLMQHAGFHGHVAVCHDLSAQSAEQQWMENNPAQPLDLYPEALARALHDCGIAEDADVPPELVGTVIEAHNAHVQHMRHDPRTGLHHEAEQIGALQRALYMRDNKAEVKPWMQGPYAAAAKAVHLQNATGYFPKLPDTIDQSLLDSLSTDGAEVLAQFAEIFNTYIAQGAYSQQPQKAMLSWGNPWKMQRYLDEVVSLNPAFLDSLQTHHLATRHAKDKMADNHRPSFMDHLRQIAQTEPELIPYIVRSIRLIAKVTTNVSHYRNVDDRNAQQAESQQFFQLITHSLISQPKLLLHLVNSGHNTKLALDKCADVSHQKKTGLTFAALIHDCMGKTSAYTLYETRDVQQWVICNDRLRDHIAAKFPKIKAVWDQLSPFERRETMANPALVQEAFAGCDWRAIGEYMQHTLYNDNREGLFRDEYTVIIMRHASMAARGLRRMGVPEEFTLAAEFHHTPHSHLDALICKNEFELATYIASYQTHLYQLGHSIGEAAAKAESVRMFYAQERPRFCAVASQAQTLTTVEDLLQSIYIAKAADVYDACSRSANRGRQGALTQAETLLEMGLLAGAQGELPPQFVDIVIDPILRNCVQEVPPGEQPIFQGDQRFQIAPRANGALKSQYGGIEKVVQRMEKVLQIIWGAETFKLAPDTLQQTRAALTHGFAMQQKQMNILKGMGQDPFNAEKITIDVCEPQNGTTIIEIAFAGTPIATIDASMESSSVNLQQQNVAFA